MLTQEDLKQIDTLLTKRIREQLRPVKEDITHIRKDMKTIINFFDKEYLQLRKRIERIEDYLKLPPIN